MDSTVGKGTTFRIFLPRHIPVAGEVAEARADRQGHADAKPPADLTGHGTILLVEDEEGLRGLNARGLTSRGYTVLEAGNGVEAIEVIESRGGDVDLVVSDVVMPEMDGPTLAKELRTRNPNLKIIFVSGYAEDAFEKNLPERRAIRFPGQAVHAQAARRRREGHDGGRAQPRLALDASGQRQDQHDHKDHAEYSGRAVAPATAMGPARNRADHEQDQDDQQDSAEHGPPSWVCARASRADRPENARGEQKFPQPAQATARRTADPSRAA